MAKVTSKKLDAILSGNPDQLGVHLHLIDQNIEIDGLKVTIHCHCLTADVNGKIKLERFVEFMRHAAVDYAIPRTRIEEAKQRDAIYRSTSAVAALCDEARALFTNLAKSGEGGEMLLYLLAERFLRKPLVLCKMDLKTDTQMHYHGADGIYAEVSDDGKLKLFWGESKVYEKHTDAIRECIRSLKPYLVEEDHLKSSRERDLTLLSDKADLGNQELSEAFRLFFDKTSPQSNRVEYCGIALVGFDAGFYPKDGGRAVMGDMVVAAKKSLSDWMESIKSRLIVEKLEQFDIHFLCVPFPSVKKFREVFQEVMTR